MSPKKQSCYVANARKVTRANSKMRSRKQTKFFVNSVHCEGNAIFQPTDDFIDLTNDDSGNNSDCEYVGTTMSNSCFKGHVVIVCSALLHFEQVLFLDLFVALKSISSNCIFSII